MASIRRWYALTISIASLLKVAGTTGAGIGAGSSSSASASAFGAVVE